MQPQYTAPPIHPNIQALSRRDLICLLFIVKLGVSGLRWRSPGVADIDQLRAELRRREMGGAE
jgi:hypothetical protein